MSTFNLFLTVSLTICSSGAKTIQNNYAVRSTIGYRSNCYCELDNLFFGGDDDPEELFLAQIRQTLLNNSGAN